MNLSRLMVSAFVILLFDTSACAQENAKQLRIMSFNIRLGVAKDGENHWDKRKQLVVQTIKEFNPDIVGTQETWDFQAKYLRTKLADFTYIGRSRQQDGLGEQCGILFRSSRFDKLIEGHFWLSESPDEPGSKSWDSSLPRMATWLKLWDRSNKNSIYVINTHFDHRGQKARVESAKLIRKFIDSLPSESYVVVTGDFNAGENSGPYRALFDRSDDKDSPIVDTFRIVKPNATANEGTFNGFNGKTTGKRIDWIAASKKFGINSAKIVTTSFENRFPSDHFPVTSVLNLVDH